MNNNRKMLLVTILILLASSFVSQPGIAQFPAGNLNDPHKYFGFEYGASGISAAILASLSLLNDTDLRSTAIETVRESLVSIWNNRLEYEGKKVPAWGKFLGEDLVYPGKKYGTVGILNTFLDYYEFSQNTTWLDYAKQGFDALMQQALNASTLPHWPYAYDLPSDPNGIPITDLKYGAGGILDYALRLYSLTQNQTYLEIGGRIANWLLQTNVTSEANGVQYYLIPWYSINSTYLPVRMGYEWGISGLAPLLYRAGIEMECQKLKDFALQMADFIVNVQFSNGSWPGEISNFPDDKIKHGYDEGVAGILYGLYQLKQLLNTTNFDTAISNGISYLFSQFISNSTHVGFYATSKHQRIMNDWNEGLVGILWVLMQLDQFLSEDQRAKVVEGLDWLIIKQTVVVQSEGKELLLFKHPLLNDSTFDFSWGHGLAGLAYLLATLPQSYAEKVAFEYPGALRGVIRAFTYFQGEDGLWPKQRTLPSIIPTGPYTNTGGDGEGSPNEGGKSSFLDGISILQTAFMLFLGGIATIVIRKKQLRTQ